MAFSHERTPRYRNCPPHPESCFADAKVCGRYTNSTIGVNDGIDNGNTEGIRYSLVSREIIADSSEAVIRLRVRE